MSKLTYLVIHCTATPEGREVTAEDIRQWHTSPLDLPKGKVRYMGITYNSRNELPNHTINGHDIKKLSGRGWQKVGYSELFTLDGSKITLVPYNDNDLVDPWEITNGASGINAISRHIVYAGGIGKDGKAKDTRTPTQLSAMKEFIFDQICYVSKILVCGHNQHANKACPSFFAPHWLKQIGVAESNIYLKDPYGYSKVYK